MAIKKKAFIHKRTAKKDSKLAVAKTRVARPRKKIIPAAVPVQRGSALFNLEVPVGAHKKRKYLGRGSGSGHGKTSTRGSKGQTSRAGRDFYLGFEGGQSPLIRKFPKRGFTSRSKKEFQVVNLSDLSRIKEASITPELLEAKGLINDKARSVKILGDGEIKTPISVKAHAFSKRAQEQIEKAGGKTDLINA